MPSTFTFSLFYTTWMKCRFTNGFLIRSFRSLRNVSEWETEPKETKKDKSSGGANDNSQPSKLTITATTTKERKKMTAFDFRLRHTSYCARSVAWQLATRHVHFGSETNGPFGRSQTFVNESFSGHVIIFLDYAFFYLEAALLGNWELEFILNK